MGQSSRDITYLPTAVDLAPDRVAIGTLMKFIGTDSGWSDTDERQLKGQFGLKDQQELPKENTKIFEMLGQQVLAAETLGKTPRMDRSRLRETRNLIRAIIAVGETGEVNNTDYNALLLAVLKLPVAALVADTKFLKPLATYCNGFRDRKTELIVADVINLPITALLTISPTPDYSAVQQLINELAVFGVTMPPHVQPTFVEELPDYRLWFATGTPLSTNARVLPKGLPIAAILKAFPPLPRIDERTAEAKIAKTAEIMSKPVDTLNSPEISAILNRHQITTVEQLLQKTVADLGIMGMRDSQKEALIYALALEGCLLKDAIKVPY